MRYIVSIDSLEVEADNIEQAKIIAKQDFLDLINLGDAYYEFTPEE